MKVKDLKAALKDVDDNLNVHVRCDGLPYFGGETEQFTNMAQRVRVGGMVVTIIGRD